MRISLLEPIGVTPELIEELSEPIRKAGHEFIYYPEKTTDPAELIRRSMGCEVVTIANNPYPDQVVLAADQTENAERGLYRHRPRGAGSLPRQGRADLQRRQLFQPDRG